MIFKEEMFQLLGLICENLRNLRGKNFPLISQINADRQNILQFTIIKFRVINHKIFNYVK